MNKAIFRFVVATLLVMCCATACARDPKVRRDRFLDSGQRYLEKGQFDAAAIQFRRALQVDPRYPESYYRLALTQLKLRQWQEAYKSLNKAVELDSKHVSARLELANLELGARQTATARSEAERVLEQDPNNLKAHLLLGQISLIEKNYKQALQEFETSQRIAPNDPTAIREQGYIYVLLKNFPEAIQYFERSITLDPAYFPGYLALAQVYGVEGNTDQQLSVLEKAVKSSPKQPAAYIALASAYLQLGQSDRVAQTFSELLKATADAPESLLAIGDFYFARGDALQAEKAFTEGLAKDTHNDSIRRRLIELALTQHHLDEAEKLDDELLKSQPKDLSGRIFKARVQFERGAKTVAVSTLEQLVHDVPEMALPHFYLGLAYAGQGDAERAIAAMNDTLEHDSSFIWAYVTMGELHLNQGSPKLALEFANRALQLNPNFVSAIVLQATAYMAMGDYSAASARLERILTAQPNNPMLLERLAIADILQKQFARGEQRLEAALADHPGYLPAVLDLVQLYKQEDRSDKIIPRLQQQIERSPKEANFYELLGDAYLAKRDYSDAQQEFEAALKLNPDSAMSNLQLARIFATENRPSEAVQIAQQIVEKHPDYLAGRLLLGSLYEQAGQVSQAEQAYQDALQRNGDFVPALNNLAWLLCENSGNLDMALSLAEHAKAKVPNDPTISDTLAWIHFRKGLYSLAAAEFGDLAEKHPQNAVYQYHLGMTLLKLGRSNEARRYLSGALSSQLTGNDAVQAKALLAKLD